MEQARHELNYRVFVAEVDGGNVWQFMFGDSSMDIRLAGFEHLDVVAELFDRYRMFYQQPSNIEGARQFLRDRLTHRDSVILLAAEKASESGTVRGAGFIQLYPSFSSVSMQRIWILNDLYVHPEFRQQGVGRSLMLRAEDYAIETRAIRIELATWVRNTSAQALYESLGYERADASQNPEAAFYHYSLELAL